jgi:hypothetical protein
MNRVVPPAPKRRKRCKYCDKLEGSAWRYDPYLVHLAKDYTYMFICDICFLESRDRIFEPPPKMYTIWQMIGAPAEMLDDRGFPKPGTMVKRD